MSADLEGGGSGKYWEDNYEQRINNEGLKIKFVLIREIRDRTKCFLVKTRNKDQRLFLSRIYESHSLWEHLKRKVHYKGRGSFLDKSKVKKLFQ